MTREIRKPRRSRLLWPKIAEKIETFPTKVNLLDYTQALFSSAYEWPDIPELYQCWIWKGAKVNKFGTRQKRDRHVFGGPFLVNHMTEYPVMNAGGRLIRAQFALWIVFYGYRPSSLVHSGCMNPLCVNPMHWREPMPENEDEERAPKRSIPEDPFDEAFPAHLSDPNADWDYDEVKSEVLRLYTIKSPASLEEFLTMLDDDDPFPREMVIRALKEDNVQLEGLS